MCRVRIPPGLLNRSIHMKDSEAFEVHWASVDRWIDETFAPQAQSPEDVELARKMVAAMRELSLKYPSIVISKHKKTP